jgi:hypothetical protein
MQKAIGLVLIGTGMLGVFLALGNQLGDLNGQAPQPLAPQDTVRSNLARWTRPVVPAAASDPVTVVVTLAPRHSSSEHLHQATPKVIGRGSPTRVLQTELKRVGCYSGAIDGDWTPASRKAMKDFTEYVNAKLPVERPDDVLVSLVQAYEGMACQSRCPTGQGFSQGRCIPDTLLAYTTKPVRAASAVAQATSIGPKQEAALAPASAATTVLAATPQSPPPEGRMALAGPDTDSNPSVVALQPASVAPHRAVRNSASPPQRSFGLSTFPRLATYGH